MRKVIAGIAILAVVIIAGLLIFVATFDVNRYHGRIQSELQERLGREVALGDMHLSVFPPRFRVENFSIGDDPQFSPNAPFIKAQALDVSVKLMPLMHKDVEIDSLELQRPSVNLIKNPAGVWNFSSLGHSADGSIAPIPPNAGPPAPHTPPKMQPNPPDSSPKQQFSLGELTIKDGQISILDQQKSKTPSLYDHIDVSLKNFSPDKPFTVDASVHMAGSGSKEARLQGEGGPIVNEHPELTPFQGTLKLKDVAVGDVSKFLNSPGLNGTDGIVTGETKINNQGGKLTAQGQTQIQNAKVRGMELGFPLSAEYDLTNDLAADLLTVRNLMLKLGATPLQLNGTVNSKPASPQLDLNVRANNVSVAEAAKLAAATGVALSQGTTATGNLDVNLQVRGSSDKPSLTGTINGSNLQLSGNAVAQPVQIPSVSLNMNPSRVQSNSFDVVSGATTLNTEFTLREYLSPKPIVDATVRAPNAQLPAILSIAKAYGITALDKVTGAGTMNLDLRASGPVKSISTPELMRALNGSMSVDFNNVKYSGANISRELSSIAGFLNPGAASASSEGVTNISKMTGNILVKNGIAQTNNLQAALDIGNVGAVGTASLIDNTLNLRVTAVLSQAVSQKAGGNSVGGYMQTALANNQGELVIPALVTGTFSNPKFAPDLQQVAQMKLKGLVPNLNNPASLTGALQNLLGGAKPTQGQQNQGQAAQGQQQPAQPNPVDQLLGLFGKKKAQPPPK